MPHGVTPLGGSDVGGGSLQRSKPFGFQNLPSLLKSHVLQNQKLSVPERIRMPVVAAMNSATHKEAFPSLKDPNSQKGRAVRDQCQRD